MSSLEEEHSDAPLVEIPTVEDEQEVELHGKIAEETNENDGSGSGADGPGADDKPFAEGGEEQPASPIQKRDLDDPEQFMKTIGEMIERKSKDVFVDHLGGPEGLFQRFSIDPEVGLNKEQVEKQRELYGINQLPMKDPVTFLEFLKEAFEDHIIQMLCVAAVISIIFGVTLPDPHSGEVKRETGWIEGFAICLSVTIVVGMGSINNYEKAKKFEELERQQAKRDAVVWRDGIQVTVDSTEVVLGDILVVESGIQFTCDCVYINGTDLKCNESAMTGEPDIIKKNLTKDPFFISGTLLEDGSGRLLVVGVGVNSFQGQLKAALDEEQGDTPLQQHLEKLADDIGKAAFISAGILLLGLIIKEIVLIADQGKEFNIATFLRFIIVAITIIVVAIPEGLPLAVTIGLAFSMGAMMKDNCLVRILASCETMGAATAICSDKTGTLTENRMTVVQGCIFDREFVLDGYGIKPRNDAVAIVDRDGDFKNTTGGLKNTSEMVDEFCFAIAINSSAREEMREGTMTWVGNKTEHGMLGFCNVVSRDYAAMRKEVPAVDQKQFPFNSAKKKMTTVVRNRPLPLFDSDGTLSLERDHSQKCRWRNPQSSRSLASPPHCGGRAA